MSKFYVLMEVGFDYNDETYFRYNGGGGHPSRVFSNKKKADEAAAQKNIEEFKRIVSNGEIREYGYGLDEVLSSKVTEEEVMYEEGIFMTLFGKTAESWWDSLYDEGISFKVQPTDAQWKRLVDCFNFQFWEVVTVEKG
jgi:hypothetical protein